MPVSFNSPPRNLFLLGSGAQDALTNFFHTINRAGSNIFNTSDIAYSDTDQKYILAGSATDSSTVSFGWMEKQAYDAETDPANPTNVEAWRRVFNSPNNNTTTPTTLNFMKQTSAYGGDIIIGGKTGNVPWISKYSASGAQQWISTSQSGDVEYFGVACTTSGYYACGHKTGTGIDAVGFVEKWDTSGTPLWGKSATHVNGSVNYNKIAANSKGEVVVVGSLTDSTYKQGYVAKIDTATGDILWDKTINSGRVPATGAKNDVEVNNVYIDGNDQIYVVGEEFADTSPTYRKGFIIKYSSEGNLIWHKTTPADEEHSYLELWSDTPVEQTVVLSRETLFNGGDDWLSLIKYSKNGDVVFKRRIQPATSYVQPSVGLDGDPSFYYMIFVEEVNDSFFGASKNYTFGKVSASGNGFGDFVYNTNYKPASAPNGRLIDYKVNNSANPIGRLADGSVRNDSSDFISYPYSGLNLLLGDDLATNVAYKKTRHREKDLFEYSGSPSIRSVDNPEFDLGTETYDVTTAGGGTPVGQAEFTTRGSYTWTAPAGVTSVCVVCIGAGGTGGAYGGSGGSLAYKNNITVTPGTSYAIEVGETNSQVNGSPYSFTAESSSAFGTVASGGEGGYSGSASSTFKTIGSNYDGGGRGGLASGDFYQAGIGYKEGCGGGAGGYQGDGGNAGKGAADGTSGSPAATAGSGGGGGGGCPGSSGSNGGGGGGTGIYGQGSNGAAAGGNSDPFGKGGSGGGDGTDPYGGQYGGGSAGQNSGTTPDMDAQNGAVRIIWGPGRSFPSTLTADQTPSAGSVTTTFIKDPTGNGNDATVDGATQDAQSFWDFDGTNDKIVGPPCSDILSADSSIELWVKFDDVTTRQTIISGYNSSGSTDPNRWDFEVKDGTFRGGFHDNGYFTSSTSISTGVWNHTILVLNSSTNTLKLYINGVEDTSQSCSGFTFASSIDLGIGDRNNSSIGPMNGKIAEVRVYKRVLTASEIFQNYNARKVLQGLATETRPDITGVIVDPTLKLNFDFGDELIYSKSHNLFPVSNILSGGTFNNWVFSASLSAVETNVLSPTTSSKGVVKLTNDDPSVAICYHPIGPFTPVSTEFTFSFYIKSVDGSTGTWGVNYYNGAAHSRTTVPITGEWQRVSITRTSPAGANTGENIYISDNRDSLADKNAAYVWGAQLEIGSTPTRHIPTDGIAIAKPTYATTIAPKSISGYITALSNQVDTGNLFNTSTYNNITYDEDDGAFVFNGTDSEIQLSSSHVTGFSGLAAGFTLEAWVNTSNFTPTDGDSSARVVGIGGTGLSGDIAILNSGQFRARGAATGGTAGKLALDPDAMNLNQWYHLICTLTESRYIKAYTNGVLKDTFDHGVGNAAFNAGGRSVQIGRYVDGGNSFQYTGKIGQIRVYARGLSASEALTNFEATRTRYGV